LIFEEILILVLFLRSVANELAAIRSFTVTVLHGEILLEIVTSSLTK